MVYSSFDIRNSSFIVGQGCRVIPFDFALVFSFGLLGSLHCVQMCGPIVLAYSLPLAGNGPRHRLIPAHLAYNAGRTLTYMLLGVLAGAAGKALGVIGKLAGFEHIAVVAAGILMIVTGLVFSGVLPLGSIFPLHSNRLPAKIYQAAAKLLQSPSRASKFILGISLGFLPCGFLYAGLLKAVETGSPVGGAATMLAFGLGTSVAMIATGMLSSFLTAPLRRWSNLIGAVGMLLLGILLVYRGLMAQGMLPGQKGADCCH
jgi:uncharacterized protein